MLKLKGKAIEAKDIGGEKVLAKEPVVLVGTQEPLEKEDGLRTYDVIPGSIKTLKGSGRKLKDVKAVLLITATCTLDPPNFRKLIEKDEMDVGKTFGEKKGLIVKHFLHSRFGKKDVGGGLYFFESVSDVEAYLSSDFWKACCKDTPWKDVKIELFEVDDSKASGFMCCRRSCS